MRVRFVTHEERLRYRYAEMVECPRRDEFIDLEDGVRWHVKWVRWAPFKVPLPSDDPLRFDVSVELARGIPDA